MENEEFIKEFGELCKRAAINNIEKMEYVNDGVFENVIVTYKNGYTKEECIESFMTSPIFEPLWSKLCNIVNDRYGDLLEAANRKGKGKTNAVWYNDPTYMTVHNKIEDCINYYKEVIINRMIRMRVIIFHKTYDNRKRNADLGRKSK